MPVCIGLATAFSNKSTLVVNLAFAHDKRAFQQKAVVNFLIQKWLQASTASSALRGWFARLPRRLRACRSGKALAHGEDPAQLGDFLTPRRRLPERQRDGA